MKRLIFTLLLFVNIPFAEAQTLPYWKCDINSTEISIPPLQLGTRDSQMPKVISKDWHIRVLNPAINCTSYPPNTDYVPVVRRKPVSKGSITVDGVSYQIFATDRDEIGIIVEVADMNGAFKPYSDKDRNFQGSTTNLVRPERIGMRFGVKYVALKRLDSGSRITVSPTPILDTGLSVGSIDLSGGEYIWKGTVTTSAVNIAVDYPTCSLTVPATVELPLLDSRTVSGAGSTAGDTSFHMDLNCDPGYVDLNVRYTLTDMSNLNNLTDTLGAMPGSSAKGFAFQVLEDGALVKFDPGSSVAGNPNQRSFGTMSKDGGRISKTLTVRYVRTNQTFVPGVLNSAASVTLSYQ